MYDPIYLLIVLFGGALVGLIGGLLRKRHLLGIATNVLFGEAFGIAAALFWPSIDRVAPGIFNGLQALGAVGSAIFYLTPILGGFVGLAVLGVYRRWVLREEPTAPALTQKNIIIVTVILACVAALAVAG